MSIFSIPAAELTAYYEKTSAEKADHHFEKLASQKLTLHTPTAHSRAEGYYM